MPWVRRGLRRLSTALAADIDAAPFHVQRTVDPMHNFGGQLPPTTKEINATLRSPCFAGNSVHNTVHLGPDSFIELTSTAP